MRPNVQHLKMSLKVLHLRMGYEMTHLRIDLKTPHLGMSWKVPSHLGVATNMLYLQMGTKVLHFTLKIKVWHLRMETKVLLRGGLAAAQVHNKYRTTTALNSNTHFCGFVWFFVIVIHFMQMHKCKLPHLLRQALWSWLHGTVQALRRLRSLLLYLCYVFWALINSLVC